MNTPDTEWEKEFDVIFPQFLEYPDSFTTQFETDPANRRKIKDFITKTISSRDTYWKERVQKEVEKTDKYREHLFGFHHCNCGLSITNEDNLK